MKTVWKVVIILVAVGIMLSVVGLSMGASRALYLNRTGVYLDDGVKEWIKEPNLGYFKNIDINAGFGDVEFLSSDKYSMEIYGCEEDWEWTLNGETLSVKFRPKQKMSMKISLFDFNFSEERDQVKVYLPADAKLETVTVNTDSGKIKLGGFSAVDVQIHNLFGNVELSGIVSDKLSVELDSGNFSGGNLSAKTLYYKNSFGKGDFRAIGADKFTAKCDSGDLILNDCAFNDTNISNSFGKITANGIESPKTNISADSGDIKLEGKFSGETVIDARFGSIKLVTSMKKELYSFDISTSFGNVTFDNNRVGGNTSIFSGNTLENHLKIHADSGDIEVVFAP